MFFKWVMEKCNLLFVVEINFFSLLSMTFFLYFGVFLGYISHIFLESFRWLSGFNQLFCPVGYWSPVSLNSILMLSRFILYIKNDSLPTTSCVLFALVFKELVSGHLLLIIYTSTYGLANGWIFFHRSESESCLILHNLVCCFLWLILWCTVLSDPQQLNCWLPLFWRTSIDLLSFFFAR